jgi:ketosteroid isomerase-like protein
MRHVSALQEEAPVTKNDTKALYYRFVAAWGARDFDALADCVTEDFVWHLPVGPDEPVGRTLIGPEAFPQEFAERERRGAQLRFEIEDPIIAGDTFLGYYTIHGTYAGGETCSYRGVDIYTVRDGRIASKDAYWKIISDSAVSGRVDIRAAA